VDVQGSLFLVCIVLMCAVALRSVKRAKDVVWVVALWVVVSALYMGLLAIFGAQ
jgi:hypothetical protein